MVHMRSCVARVSNICPVYPSTYRIQIAVFSLAWREFRLPVWDNKKDLDVELEGGVAEMKKGSEH